ncbi:hypothetical protein [Paludibaculum fermentans]|uniref:Uncharacterized protein n=1 Tax=Paludibaculum fermentans TaxID=1473598 RepID=A0A7S7NL72_PALFE|nr:hypothetical protein [Paludibaculum fermentans]QOY85633.1 hypothetical protein IRI77_22735 [Paludibaculum fermentans]
MNWKLPAVCLLCTLATAQPRDLARDLDNVARTATVMVDGDICLRIQTERSRGFMFKEDPKDPYLASDNYDVEHEAFTRTKKTLIRLSRLCPLACDVNLWLPLDASKSRVQVMIRNVHEMSSFWKWGVLHQPMPPEMKRVLDTGERVTVSGPGGKVSVLAPVRNSLDDIVALVEVVAQQRVDPQENVK